MDPQLPQDAHPAHEDERPAIEAERPAHQDERPAAEDARPPAARGRAVLDVLLLVAPVCILTAIAAPVVGAGIFAAAWSHNVGAVLAGLALLTLVIALASGPGRALVRPGETWRTRLPWAAGVCLLGTLLVAVGAFLWHHDQAPFGSAAQRLWLVGAAYALAAAARSRSRPLRTTALSGIGATVALALVVAMASGASHHSTRPTAQPVPLTRIPSSLLLVGDTPAGYRPVPVWISPDSGAWSPFLASYTCVSNCPPPTSPGHAAMITFEAAQAGPDDFSDYQALCDRPAQGYVCTGLGPDMWLAIMPSSPTVSQVAIYEHGGVEFTLDAPRTMDPQLLRAYMLSIHRASEAELTSLLQGYPNYS